MSQSGNKPPENAATTLQSSQKSPEPQKKAAALSGTKVMCYYRKKPGHILAHCKKRLAKLSGASTSSDAAPVQLISTVRCQQSDQLVPDPVVKFEQADPVEPGFTQHCATGYGCPPKSFAENCQRIT